MNQEADSLVNSYIEWLKSKIKTTEIDGWQEISTPFLDRHNDYLRIYVKHVGDKLKLTDDGYIISDLSLAGCDLDSTRRRELLTTILNGFGVQLEDSELTVETKKEDFPRKKHLLIQAMLSVNDMFMTTRSRVASLFWEDIERYFDANDIRYTPSIQLVGKSGFSHRFDFVIPKSNRAPERLIQAVNNPTKDKTSSVLFTWDDTKDVRRAETSMYVLLNDQERKVSTDILHAFDQYGVTAIEWSGRDKHLERLRA